MIMIMFMWICRDPDRGAPCMYSLTYKIKPEVVQDGERDSAALPVLMVRSRCRCLLACTLHTAALNTILPSGSEATPYETICMEA